MCKLINRMKTRLLTFLFILCYSYVTATNTNINLGLSGTIYSAADSLPLSGAVIEVLMSDSVIARSVSDKNGRFIVKCQHKNSISSLCLFKVSYIGHVTFYTSIKGDSERTIDMGKIYLTANNELAEVVIHGDNVIQKVDKTIVIPTKTDIKASTNSIELLSNLNLPGLMANVIEKKVTINGLGAIYQINGRQQSREQFMAVNPENILRIEYSDHASSRYINQNAGGVINAILKKKVTGGDAFINATTSPTTAFLNGTAKASYNFNHSEFSLLYDNSLRDYSKRKIDQNESFINNLGTTSRKNMGLNAPFGYISQNIDLSYTYVPNDKSMLSVIIGNQIGHQHDENKWNIDEMTNHNNLSFYRNSNYKYNSYSPSFDIYFTQKLKKNESIEANVVGTLLNSYYTRKLSDNEVITTQNRIDNRRRSLIAEILHKKTFEHLSWDLGVNHNFSHTKNVYSNSTNSITRMDVNDTYLYTQITGKVKKLSYDIGAGLKIYGVNNDTDNKSFFRNLTTVNFLYPLSSYLKVSYRFQFKPVLPSLSQMSNVIQYYDALTGIKGNPDLKSYSTSTNRILFIYNKKKFRANLWLSYYISDNPIGLSTYYDEGKNIFISEYLNQKKNDKVNTQVDLIYNSIFNHINLAVSGGWQRFSSKGEDYQHTLYNLYWSANLSAYYKNLSISANYVRPQKSLTAEQIVLAENYSSVMLMYKKNNLSLSLGVSYPFTKEWESSEWSLSKVHPSYKHVSIRDNGNMLTLGCSYYLNFGKNLKKSKKSVNNIDNESGILKVE